MRERPTMSTALDFVALHWLSLLLLAVAPLAVLALWRHRSAALAVGGGAALFGLGGLLLPMLPAWVPWLVAGTGAALLLGLVVMLLLTGDWLRPLVPVGAALLCVGGAGLLIGPLSDALVDLGLTLATLEVLRPTWLLLIGLIPVFVALSRRRLELAEADVAEPVGFLALLSALYGAALYFGGFSDLGLWLLELGGVLVVVPFVLLVVRPALVRLFVRRVLPGLLPPAAWSPGLVAARQGLGDRFPNAPWVPAALISGFVVAAAPAVLLWLNGVRRRAAAVDEWRPWASLALRCLLVLF